MIEELKNSIYFDLLNDGVFEARAMDVDREEDGSFETAILYGYLTQGNVTTEASVNVKLNRKVKDLEDATGWTNYCEFYDLMPDAWENRL